MSAYDSLIASGALQPAAAVPAAASAPPAAVRSPSYRWGSHFWDAGAEEFTEHWWPSGDAPAAAAATVAAAPVRVSSGSSSLPAGLFALAAPAASSAPTPVVAPSVASALLQPAVSVSPTGSYALSDFARMLGQHLVERFGSTNSPPPPPPDLFSSVLSATLDILEGKPKYLVGQSGRVGRPQWMDFLRRFGPMSSVVSKCCAAVRADGTAAPWFRAEQTRDTVDSFIASQGAGFAALVRLKLAPAGSPDEQVCSLSLRGGAHYQVFHRSSGAGASGYTYPSAPGQSVYPTLRAMLHALCSLEAHGADAGWIALKAGLTGEAGEWAALAESARAWTEAGRSSEGSSSVSSGSFLARHWGSSTVASLAAARGSPAANVTKELLSVQTVVQGFRDRMRNVATLRESRTAAARETLDFAAVAAEEAERAKNAVAPVDAAAATAGPSSSSPSASSPSSSAPAPALSPSAAHRLHARVSGLAEAQWLRLGGMWLELSEEAGRRIIALAHAESAARAANGGEQPQTQAGAAATGKPEAVARRQSVLKQAAAAASAAAAATAATASSSVAAASSSSSPASAPSPAPLPASAPSTPSARLESFLSPFSESVLVDVAGMLRDAAGQWAEVARYFAVVQGRMTMASSSSSGQDQVAYDLPRLRTWENTLYAILGRVLFALGASSRPPPPAPQGGGEDPANNDLLWFRLFDPEESKVATARFACALRLHVLQEHWAKAWGAWVLSLSGGAAFDEGKWMRPRVPAPGVLHKILSVTADTDGGNDSGPAPSSASSSASASSASAPAADGFITHSEWILFLSRFGPSWSCVPRARSACVSQGGRAGFWVPNASMAGANEILNAAAATAGGAKFLLRLGRSPPHRAFVLVVKRDASAAPVHLYVSLTSRGPGGGGYHIEAPPGSSAADVKVHPDLLALLAAVAKEVLSQYKLPSWESELLRLEEERHTVVDVRHAHALKVVEANAAEADETNKDNVQECDACRYEASAATTDGTSGSSRAFFQCVRGCAYALCSRCVQEWRFQDSLHGVGPQLDVVARDAASHHPAAIQPAESGVRAHLFRARVDAADAERFHSALSIHPASIRPDDRMIELTLEWAQTAHASRNAARADVLVLQWLTLPSSTPPPLLAWSNLSVAEVSRFRIAGFSLVHCLVEKALSSSSSSGQDGEGNGWLQALEDLAKAGVPVHLKATTTSSAAESSAAEDGAEQIPFAFLNGHRAGLDGVRPVVLAVRMARAVLLPSNQAKTHLLAGALASRRLCCLRLVQCFLSYPLGVGTAGSDYADMVMSVLREGVQHGLHEVCSLILQPLVSAAQPAGVGATINFSPRSLRPTSGASAPATADLALVPSNSSSERAQCRSALLGLLHGLGSTELALGEHGVALGHGVGEGDKAKALPTKGSFLHFMATCSSRQFREYVLGMLPRGSQPSTILANIVHDEVQRTSHAMGTVLESLMLTFPSVESMRSYLAAKTSSHYTATFLAAVNHNLPLFDALIFHPDVQLLCNQRGSLLHYISRVWSAEDIAQRLDRLNQRAHVHTQASLDAAAFLAAASSHRAPPVTVRSFSTTFMRQSSLNRAVSASFATSPTSSSSSSSGLNVANAADELDLPIKLNALNSFGQTAVELVIQDLYPSHAEASGGGSAPAGGSDERHADRDREHDDHATRTTRARKKDVLVFLIERGARLPAELSKVQLLSLSQLLFASMRSSPALRYRIPERAVKNGDVALFSLLFKPLLDRQSCVAPVVEFFNPDSRRFQSLLLLACDMEQCRDEDDVEQRSAAIVETLINYKPSAAASKAALPSALTRKKSSVNALDDLTATLDRLDYNREDAQTQRNALHLIIGGVADVQSVKQCTRITELLLATRQFDLMASDFEGCNVLHLAARNNLIQVVDMLISEHIALDARTLCRTHAMSALHIAAEHGHWQLTISLLQAGADVNLRDGKGETALTKAMLAQRALEAELTRREAGEDEGGDEVAEEAVLRLDDADLRQLLIRYQRTSVELLKSGASIHESCEHSDEHTVDCLVNINSEFMRIHRRVRRSEDDDSDSDDDDEENDADDDDGGDVYADAGSDPDAIFSLKLTQIVMAELYELHVKSRHVARLVRFFLTLLLLTYVCVYSSNTGDEKSAYHLTQSLQSKFADDAFNGASSHADVWQWTRQTLHEAIYSEPGASITPILSDSPALASNVLGHNHLIGLVRLRQIRAAHDPFCAPQGDALLKDWTRAGKKTVCVEPSSTDESASIGSGQTELWPGGPLDRFPFRSSADLGGASWPGSYARYEGSGFVVDLPSPNSEGGANHTLAALAHLEAIGWLDSASRAVFVEFTLFNARENHFVVATMLVEFPPTGGALPSADFSVHKLARVLTSGDQWFLFLQVLLLAMMLAYFSTEWIEVRSQGIVQYVQSFYNLLDVAMFALTATIVALQVYGMILSAQLDWFTTTAFVPVQPLAAALWWHSQLSSLLVFIAWLKSIEFFAVFKDISRLTVMIEMVALKMVPFFVVLLISLCAFASAEYIAYGYRMGSSFTLHYSILSRITQTFSYDSDLANFEFMRSFYSIAFAISICLVMLNLVVAILNSAYEDALQDSGDSYWAKKQYGMIVHSLLKKKSGKLNAYDLALERLVAFVSTLLQSLPSLPAESASSAASASDLCLADLDAADTPIAPVRQSSGAAAAAAARASRSRSGRQARIVNVSTAPAWMRIIPAACKHAAAASASRSASAKNLFASKEKVKAS